MPKYARLNPDDTIAEIRSDLRDRPDDIPAKGVRWFLYEDAKNVDFNFYSLGGLKLSGDVVTNDVKPRELEQIQSTMINKIKSIAEKKIIAIMPIHKQRNFTALGVESLLSYGADVNSWPDQLRNLVTQGVAAFAEIKRIRDVSNAKELEVLALDFQSIQSYDIDAGWPDVV